MAEKRMFSLSVVDTDWFLDLPLTTQALYFHLSMRADDDGFVDAPKSIMRKIGCSNNDYQLLVAKRYILEFESGVIVIKHWRMNNTLRSDRYKPTQFQEELNSLELKENKSYTEKKDLVYQRLSDGIPSNISISKTKSNNNSNNIRNKYGELNNVLLTEEEFNKLKEKFPKDYLKMIDNLSYYISSKGDKYKSHYATILNWNRKEEKENPKPKYTSGGFESLGDDEDDENPKYKTNGFKSL